jgi:hypothetical protein
MNLKNLKSRLFSMTCHQFHYLLLKKQAAFLLLRYKIQSNNTRHASQRCAPRRVSFWALQTLAMACKDAAMKFCKPPLAVPDEARAVRVHAGLVYPHDQPGDYLARPFASVAARAHGC